MPTRRPTRSIRLTARPPATGRSRVASDAAVPAPDAPAPGAGAPAPSRALSDALDQVGDRWTLLVVATLLGGPQRFGDLLAQLDGLAPNILSKRLARLEADGLVVGEPYSRRPLRHAYRLTASGAELAGVVRTLAQWGVNQRGAGTPPADDHGLVHEPCSTPLEARWFCPTCARTVDDPDAETLRWL